MLSKTHGISTVLLLLTLLTGCREQVQPATLIPDVPQENTPLIDGTLSTGEWDAAREESFKGGSQLFLLTDSKYLYMGIRSNFAGMLMGNIFIQRGDTISILHTSGALGTAIYQQGPEDWRLIQDFTWQCRDAGDSQTIPVECKAFLDQEGWLGSMSYMGNPEELEYQIELTAEPMHILVVFENLEYAGLKYLWPAQVEVNIGELTHGYSPPNLSFSPEEWAEITVNRDGEVEVSVPTPQE
jgi:hypothetical protein